MNVAAEGVKLNELPIISNCDIRLYFERVLSAEEITAFQNTLVGPNDTFYYDPEARIVSIKVRESRNIGDTGTIVNLSNIGDISGLSGWQAFAESNPWIWIVVGVATLGVGYFAWKRWKK